MSKKNFPLTWSTSRDNTFEYCKKQYFFNYYPMALKDELGLEYCLEVLTAKYLSNLKAWIGNEVHTTIARLLHTLRIQGDLPQSTVDKIKQNTIEEMKMDFKMSKKKNYNRYDKHNKFGLIPHYKGITIDSDFEMGLSFYEKCVDSFYDSQLFKRVVELVKNKDKNIKLFIEPIKTDFDQMQFVADDIKGLKPITIFAQPDLGIIVDDKIIIYDWKTGRVPNKDSKSISDQLKTYAYKTYKKLGEDNFDKYTVKAYEYYLPDKTVYGGQIETKEIKDVKIRIKESVNKLKKYIKGGKIKENKAISSNKFYRTKSIKKCKQCQFFNLCKQLKKHETKRRQSKKS